MRFLINTLLISIFIITIDPLLAQTEDSNDILQECKNNSNMRTWHDCECLAKGYQEKREELGPMKPKSHILLLFRDKCKNPTGIADDKYKNCIKMPSTFLILPKGVDKNKFCECDAQVFTDMYMNYQGRISQKLKAEYAAKARAKCRNQLSSGSKSSMTAKNRLVENQAPQSSERLKMSSRVDLTSAAETEKRYALQKEATVCKAYKSLTPTQLALREYNLFGLLCKTIGRIASVIGTDAINNEVRRLANYNTQMMIYSGERGGKIFSYKTMSTCNASRTRCDQACQKAGGLGCYCNTDFAVCLAESLND